MPVDGLATQKTISQTMKHIMKHIMLAVLVMSAALTVTSCLGDEEETIKTPECAIMTFSVNDIKSGINTVNHAGNDSTYYLTISGSEVKFNIDQTSGRITSIDSLPHWTDLTHVVPNFSSYGQVYVLLDNAYYYLTSGKDSIDFTNPVELLAVASDGISSKRYVVSINKNENDVDSLMWETLPQQDLSINGSHRLFSNDSQLYVFAKNEDGKVIVSTSSNGTTWASDTAKAEIDIDNIIQFHDAFYAIDSNKQIFTSDNATDWTSTSATADRMLAADADYIYILRDGKILSSTDLSTWTINGTSDINMLPEANISSIAYSTKTNSTINNVIMAGTTPSYADGAVVWYKISSADKSSDQQWNYIQVTTDNSYPLPHGDYVKLMRINGQSIAYVADYGKGTHQFFASDDNGITWHQMTTYAFVPSEMETSAPTSITVMGNNVWMLQSGTPAKVWKGTLK